MTTTCQRCDTTSTHPLCDTCTRQLDATLHAIPSLLDLLDDTTARLDHIDRPSGPQDDDPDRGLPLTAAVTPLPFAIGASDAGTQLRAVLTGWARVLYDGLPLTVQPPPDGYGAALWLAQRLHHLAEHPAADEAHHEITTASAAAWALIDRPPDTWWVGPCGEPLGDGPLAAHCTSELYARTGAKTITCPGCRARHDVTARRERMLDAAALTLVTATEAARALTSLDQPVTPSQVWGWVHRGHLHARDRNAAGQPRYRLGDVAVVHQRIRFGQQPAPTQEAS